ncbi:MAG: hypothetical protein M3384_00755 [Acidobacteriota bacterium]|nr:hypothetical protein [Acidobacteriota bacterium]
MNEENFENKHAEETVRTAEAAAAAARVLALNRALWILWWAGTALIVLSWFKVVSNTISWIGFSAALASTFIGVVARRYWKFPQ